MLALVAASADVEQADAWLKQLRSVCLRFCVGLASCGIPFLFLHCVESRRVRVCVHACMRACVRFCVRMRVCACVSVRLRACVCVCGA